MPVLAHCAEELETLVREGRRIRLGQRNPETPYAELDALWARLDGLAARMHGMARTPATAANDRGVWQGPHVVVTGLSQILHAPGRRLRP